MNDHKYVGESSYALRFLLQPFMCFLIKFHKTTNPEFKKEAKIDNIFELLFNNQIKATKLIVNVNKKQAKDCETYIMNKFKQNSSNRQRSNEKYSTLVNQSFDREIN